MTMAHKLSAKLVGKGHDEIDGIMWEWGQKLGEKGQNRRVIRVGWNFPLEGDENDQEGEMTGWLVECPDRSGFALIHWCGLFLPCFAPVGAAGDLLGLAYQPFPPLWIVKQFQKAVDAELLEHDQVHVH